MREVALELYIGDSLKYAITGEYSGTGDFGLSSEICIKDCHPRTIEKLLSNLEIIASTADSPDKTYEIKIKLGEEK